MSQTKLNVGEGKHKVVKYFGPFNCQKYSLDSENIDKCDKEAIIKLSGNGDTKRYCRTHAKDSWLKMAGVSE